MFMPGKTDLVFIKDRSFKEQLLASDESGAINWTGYSAKLQVRRFADDAPIITLISPTHITLTSGGQITVNVQDTSSYSTLVAGNYKYDLELYQGTYSITLIYGTFTVQESITR